MKICHCTSVHQPEDVRIFYKECTSLANNGNDVYLVEQGNSYEKNGVHIVGIGVMPSSRIARILCGSRKVYRRALSLDCDIYHFHDPELLPYGLKLKKRGKKVIFDIHENVALSILEKQYFSKSVAKVVAMIYQLYERIVCSRLDALITVTPTQTDYYKRINPITTEIRNYPIFRDIRHQSGDGKKKLVFAGGVTKQWNHENIINSIENMDDVNYIICGSEGKYSNYLRQLSGWNKVVFLGKIPHEQVWKVLSESNIGMALLTPGNNTAGKIGTMGNTKIFEEMMAGLPVICSDFQLWVDIVEKNNCGICVDPNNEEQITKAIEHLVNNPEIAKRMGENGTEIIKNSLNWAEEEKKLLKLYGSI